MAGALTTLIRMPADRPSAAVLPAGRDDAVPDLRSHELALEHGDRVHLAQHDAAVGVHGIRWEFAG